MKKILVPCDFSPAAQEAFQFAVRIAIQNESEIHVLYVIDMTFLRGTPSLANTYAFNLNFLKELEQEIESKYQKMWERYSPLTLPVKFKHRIGTLLTDIDNYVTEHKIDLVIMGTHGDGGKSWGSNTQKIVQNSSVPVFAIRKAPKEVERIVVPVVPEQTDDRFYGELKKLQAFFNASIQFVWINTPLIFKSDPKAKADLEQFAQRYRFSNYDVHVRADYSVEEGVLRFSAEIGGDMIAMRTHAWKGFMHFVLGSYTEDIVNHASLPVWTCAAK
jgi:nucleotide-binding universal stress UspA family protein